ncbi:MAG TPA: secretin N-terminal domain-containing protein [Gemmataceae bacterium]|nr:secretin N-terminal domain-containing protein [Gemmataceae bacterium]
MKAIMIHPNLRTPLIVGSVLLLGAVGAWGQDGLDREIAFEMRDKPWSGEKGSVLEWLSEQTGLPVSLSRAKPAGTLTFINPRQGGAPRHYRLGEVIDILNDELFKQKLILIRRAKTFTIEPFDEKIDPAALPRVLPGELDRYGNTELVSVVFSLPELVAEDFAKEIKGMLGPLGTVAPLAQANKVIVQDTVANLKRIRDLVKETGQRTQKTPSGCFSHPCLYVPARHAARVLQELLGDPKELLQVFQAQLSVREAFAGQFGTFADVPKMRLHHISVDERSNTVLVTGSADKIAQAEAILKTIDVPQEKDQQPIRRGPAVLKSYPVPDGNAGVLAKSLQEIYKDVPEIRIGAVTNHSIMVWAGPREQVEILGHIRASKAPESTVEVIPLHSLSAGDTVDTLKGMLGSDAKPGATFLQADTKRNAIVAKGTRQQIGDVKFMLKALGEENAPPPSGTLVLTIEQGSTATQSVAEALERVLPQLLQNPVQIQTFGGHEAKGERSKPESLPR